MNPLENQALLLASAIDTTLRELDTNADFYRLRAAQLTDSFNLALNVARLWSSQTPSSPPTAPAPCAVDAPTSSLQAARYHVLAIRSLARECSPWERACLYKSIRDAAVDLWDDWSRFGSKTEPHVATTDAGISTSSPTTKQSDSDDATSPSQS